MVGLSALSHDATMSPMSSRDHRLPASWPARNQMEVTAVCRRRASSARSCGNTAEDLTRQRRPSRSRTRLSATLLTGWLALLLTGRKDAGEIGGIPLSRHRLPPRDLDLGST